MTKCLDNINVKGLEKWILSFCLFAFLPFHASAIDVKGKKNSAVVDGISYQLNAKKETAIVVKSPDIYSGDLVIPEKIEVDSLTFYVEEIAASAFEKATGVKLNYQIVGRRAGDIEKVWGNVDKANRVLGWKADTPLEDVLASAWKWQCALRERGIM